jgi:hypothetical protein
MTDTQKTESREAVAYVDGRPLLEVACGEYVYPIDTEDGKFTVHCGIRPYQPYAIKKFYDGLVSRRKRRTPDEQTIEFPDYAEAIDFILGHLGNLYGVELADGTSPSAEDQKRWLEQNRPFAERIFRFGVDYFFERQETPESGRVVLVFGRREHRIPVELRLYAPKTKRVEAIELFHVLDRMSQSDRHQYDRAVSVVESSKRGERFVEANWDVVEGLYNQRAKAVDGALVEGVPCTEANRDAWIKLIPFCLKVHVMHTAMREIELGNG